METKIDITQLSLEQLKAMVYDLLVLREEFQVKINALNAEIVKRRVEPDKIEEVKKADGK